MSTKQENDDYVRVGKVADILLSSVPTVWRWNREGTNGFPKAVKLGPNITAWRRDEILAYKKRREDR